MAPRLPSPGLVVDGKYQLAERIGGGGMGDVYRAVQIARDRVVAIKLLHPELSENADIAQRFFQEALASNRIRHPTVVEIIEAGVSEIGPYLAMEYLEGESVGAALQRTGRFDATAVVATILPVLEALEAAHRAGIVHRDLKPENVFLATGASRATPVVRLLDFGIAKLLDPSEASPRTRTGVVFGTPDYLSPEQATGEAAIDGRSDLFAVGILLYELLTGSRPFRGPTAMATAFKVVHSEAPPLASTGVDVDPRLEGVMAKLLQKSPAKRFQIAGDAARELERIAPDPKRRLAALALLCVRRPSPTGFMRTAARPMPPQPPAAARAEAVPSSKRAREIEPAPTSLPARYRGRFHARGPVLRAVDSAMRTRFGDEARSRVVKRLAEPYAADFLHNSLNALVAYDLEALDAYLGIATEEILGDVQSWREIGRSAADGELASMLRLVLQPESDLGTVVRRGTVPWSRLLDFGAWRVSELDRGRIELRVDEIGPACRALRLWLVGVVEQTARRATGADLHCSITLGETSFTPELACEIAWPA